MAGYNKKNPSQRLITKVLFYVPNLFVEYSFIRNAHFYPTM